MTKVKTISNEELFADVERIVGEGGSVSLRLKGYSMSPFLCNERDSVELAPVGATSLRRGMVVLFRHGGRHILHRIRRIDQDRLTIKGDGNYRATEYADRRDVIAFVSSAQRNGRKIDYGSLRWRLLTAYSLSYKFARTIYTDLKLKIE